MSASKPDHTVSVAVRSSVTILVTTALSLLSPSLNVQFHFTIGSVSLVEPVPSNVMFVPLASKHGSLVVITAFGPQST